MQPLRTIAANYEAPDDVPCVLNKARCLGSLGREDEALQWCERALELLADVRREDAEDIDGLRLNMDAARQYIDLLEEEDGKKGAELEEAGEYVRKLEELIANQKAALAAREQELASLDREPRRPGGFGLFKMHVKSEGLSATLKRSLAHAGRRLKRGTRNQA